MSHEIDQNHKQALNSIIDSQNINTTKPLHFQFYKCKFNHIP